MASPERFLITIRPWCKKKEKKKKTQCPWYGHALAKAQESKHVFYVFAKNCSFSLFAFLFLAAHSVMKNNKDTSKYATSYYSNVSCRFMLCFAVDRPTLFAKTREEE